jgi:hypothetical protein
MAKVKNEKTEVKEENLDQLDNLLKSKEYQDKHLGSRSGADIKWPEKITTGSLIFDQILEGGYRCGWSRFSSPEECGKTSQGLVWGKNWQKHFPENGMVIYFNAEGRITKDLLDRSGIDTSKNKFRIIDSNNGDFIFDLTEKLILDNPNGLRYFWIYDSSDAMKRSQDEGKGFSEPEKIGGQATLNSAAGRRLSLPISIKGHHLYMCSQIRAKMATGPAGGGSAPSGGNAPKFYSSLTGEIAKPWSDTFLYENPSDKKSRIIGRMVTIKLKKTPNEKSDMPVEFPVKYGLIGGVWRNYESMMMAQMWDFYKAQGTWFTINEEFAQELSENKIEFETKVQGEKNLINLFDNNQKLSEYVIDKVSKLTA